MYIYNSYYSGELKSERNSGGIMGSMDGERYITNSYNRGKITGDWAGGIVGYCYNRTKFKKLL